MAVRTASRRPARRVRIAPALLFLLCAACAGAPQPSARPAPVLFDIAGLEIRNELVYRVTEVQVLDSASGGFVSCGTVFPGTACATSFPLREYRGEALSVSWKEHGQPQAVDEFVLEVPAAFDTSRPVWVQVVVFAPGSAGARVLSRRPDER